MSWEALTRSVRHFYESQGDGSAGASLVQMACEVLSVCERRPPTPMAPRSLPVARYLDAINLRQRPSVVQAVIQSIMAIRREADWRQNPNYTRATAGQHFVDNYGYLEFVGPGRRYDCADIRIGVLMLGQGVEYAEHAHPAEEVYHPLMGDALWWCEDTNWRTVPTGAAVHHPPWVSHAMQTETQPLLALYCWGGNIGPAAKLTEKSMTRQG